MQPIRLYVHRQPLALILLGTAAGLFAATGLVLVYSPKGWVLVALIVSIVLLGLFAGWIIFRLIRPRIYLEIDDAGISWRGSRVPWSGVREVRVIDSADVRLVEVSPHSARPFRFLLDDIPVSLETLIAHMHRHSARIVVTETGVDK